MKPGISGPDLAQCATCGGILVPAGDDWTHLDDNGCTLYGVPILCDRGDCAHPAMVGGTACRACAGIFLLDRYTAAVDYSGRGETER